MRLSIAEFTQRFPDHAVARELLGASSQEVKNHTKGKTSAGQKPVSVLESFFAEQIHLSGLLPPEREFKFHPRRKWRMDFAWPCAMLAAEIEGGVWSYGRHNRPHGFVLDAEKYNAAGIMGWTVLRFTGKHVRDGTALQQVRQVLTHRAMDAPP